MGRLRLLRLATVAFLTLVGSLASASETITYTYDVHGRLTAVVHSGSVNNGTSVSYAHDAADNRSNVTVTGVAGTSFSIANAAAAVNEGGTLAYTVTKSGPAAANVTFAAATGTATLGIDFTASSGTLTFLAGDVTKTVNVVTLDDTTPEGAETVLVNLSSPTNGATIAVGQGQGSGTINASDQSTVTVSVNDPAPVTEGSNIVFTITRSGGTTSSTVAWSLTPGNATTPADYSGPTSGNVTFASGGANTKSVTVTTVNNSTPEPTENFTINLNSASNGVGISDPQGVGTINDDDNLITLTDSQLNVLSAHVSVYNCQIDSYYDFITENFWYSETCWLDSSSSDIVYDYYVDNMGGTPIYLLAPGYSYSGGILKVQSSYYGTAP